MGDKKVENDLHSNLYVEIDKLKHENELKESTINDLHEKFHCMEVEMKKQRETQNNFIAEFVAKSDNPKKITKKKSKLLNKDNSS